MNALFALFIVLLIFSIGDVIASKTKALISMMLAGAIIFMIAFWCGLPKTIFVDSGLLPFAGITISMFLAHIGSTIKIRDFIREWKTVVVVFFGTIAIAFGVFFIGQLFMDRYYALAGAPVLAGGMVAYLIMSELGEILARPEVAVFAVLILTFQNFIGVPVASFFCKKEGLRVRDEFRAGNLTAANQEAAAVKKLVTLPEFLSTPNFILCKLALVGYISSILAAKTGVSILIFSLILGVVFSELGIIEENALTKANGFGFVVAGAIVTIFAGLVNTTPEMVASMIFPLIMVLVIGTICCSIAAIIVGKVVNFSWQLSIGLAMTAFFGFPGTYLISTEVANASGDTPEERKAVLDSIMPKMVIAGIVSVSVVSGLIAGVMVKWI